MARPIALRRFVMQTLPIVSLDSWSTAWNTTFNAGKAAHMVISSHPPASTAPPLLPNMKPVPYANEVKHLSLVTTSALQLSSHFHSLLLPVGYRVYLLRRLAYRVTSPAFVKRLYVALLQLSLEYASSVWDGACRKKDSFALERTQLSIARAVLRRSRRNASNREVLEEIGWPTLAWRRRRAKLSLLWQVLHGQGPPSLQRIAMETAAVRAHQSSLGNQLCVAYPMCRTRRRAQLFFFLLSALLPF